MVDPFPRSTVIVRLRIAWRSLGHAVAVLRPRPPCGWHSNGLQHIKALMADGTQVALAAVSRRPRAGKIDARQASTPTPASRVWQFSHFLGQDTLTKVVNTTRPFGTELSFCCASTAAARRQRGGKCQWVRRDVLSWHRHARAERMLRGHGRFESADARATCRRLLAGSSASGNGRLEISTATVGRHKSIGMATNGTHQCSLWRRPDSPYDLDGCRTILDSVAWGSHGGLASYRAGEPPSTAMTAESLLCRLFLGVPPKHPLIEEGAAT